MQAHRLSWDVSTGWQGSGRADGEADLVLYFGGRSALADGARSRELMSMFPRAQTMGCTTGGQIFGDDVTENGVAAIALAFDSTRVRMVRQPLANAANSEACGAAIGAQLSAPDLAGIFVLSEGLRVNGTKLVSGLVNAVGPGVPITGGLAGDGARFEKTLVAVGAAPESGVVGAIGFYGNKVKIGHGSAGGWDVFGPRRLITRARDSVLIELDNQPALDLYERYLGAEESAGLPGTALLFPLQIFSPAHPEHALVRTVLAIDRDKRTMTFAGEMPEGWIAQLMRGNFGRLTAGSADAARQARGSRDSTVAILISCIGRRLLMGQRTIDEVEAARAQLGPDVEQIGFYSYGEISPQAQSGYCELHNQTMTITTIGEAA